MNIQQTLHYLVCTILLVGLLSGCQARLLPQPPFVDHNDTAALDLPDEVLYVVTTGAGKSELLVLDAVTLQEVNRSDLLPTNIWHISRDPLGRLWIGYAGAPDFTTAQVDGFRPDGHHLRTLEPCKLPNSGVHFAANRAFIPCADNGFQARMAVVDLSSLAIIEMFTLDDFFLLAAAADGETVVVLGSAAEHASLVFIDPHSLAVTATLPIYGGVNVRTIIPHDHKFYLLSSGSFRHPADHPIDLRIVTPGHPPTLTEHRLGARSPLWGVIAGNQLYAYHNPTYTTTKRDPGRALSRYDLSTGESKVWPLPAYWDARDMVWADGRILLTRSLSRDPEAASGIYAFDVKTGQLNQMLQLPRAKQVLPATLAE